MRLKLQFVLIIGVLIIFCSSSKAQTERAKLLDQRSIKSSSEPIPVYPNIPETKIARSTLAPANNTTGPVHAGKPELIPAPSAAVSLDPEKQMNREKPASNTRKVKTPEEIAASENVPVQKNAVISETVGPEFKVTATREEPYEVKVISVEKKPQQLTASAQNRPAMGEEMEKPAASSPNQFTISPLKRKYLEGIVQELEQEILLHPNDQSSDMLAKRKELDDLKKLLAH